MSVDYENPGTQPIDAMGAAILFGRCLAAAPDCEAVAQRPADNSRFDAKQYYSLIGGQVPSSDAHHH